MNGGFNALVAIFLFFFLEETNFERPESEIVLAPRPDAGELEQVISNGSMDKKVGAETSVQQVLDPTLAAQPEVTSRTQNSGDLKIKKPWMTWGKVSPHAAAVMLRGCLVPLSLLALPLIWWIGLMYGIYQIWFNSECHDASFKLVLTVTLSNWVARLVDIVFTTL
jgi:hypothetical protein